MNQSQFSTRRRFVVAVLLLAAAGSTRAEERPPDGIPVGPWILAPSVIVGSSRDSNPFLRSQDDVIAFDGETVTRVSPEFVAYLPFRKSAFRVDAQGRYARYSQTPLPKPWATTIAAELDLRFGSGDRLDASASRTGGSAETFLFDPGGATVFRGESYVLNSYRILWERAIPQRAGWTVAATHDALTFDAGTELSFFNYDGWTYEAGYRNPVGAKTFWTLAKDGRRFDNVLANDTTGGAPFRTEDSGTWWTGLEGSLRPGEPWKARFGRATSRFRRDGTGTYKAWTFDGAAALQAGAGTTLSFVASHKLYPSIFFDNDAYTATSVVAAAERRNRRQIAGGVTVALSRTSWPKAVPQVGDPDVTVRRYDRLARVEGYVNVPIRSLVGLRVSTAYQWRSSTYRTADFRDLEVFGGLALGWY